MSDIEEWVRVGEFEFDRRKELGKGGFGFVYQGRSLRNRNTKVAVKVIEHDGSSNLKREIDVLKEISSLKHENFVQLLYSEERPDSIILVMELCNEDMDRYLKKHKKLPEPTVALFLKQIVKGLQVLKSRNIIHRDFKPQNLLLLYTVQNPKPGNIIIKIADFGLARYTPDYYQYMTYCGTTCYMAPEVLMSEPYGSEVDVWSVGVMVHLMAFGSVPFQEPHSQTTQNYRCPSSASAPLQDLLCRMLKRKPSERIDLQSLANHPFLG